MCMGFYVLFSTRTARKPKQIHGMFDIGPPVRLGTGFLRAFCPIGDIV